MTKVTPAHLDCHCVWCIAACNLAASPQQERQMMSLGKAVRAIAIVCVLGAFASAQQPTVLQTPRQAIIEMMSGGEAGLMKHLTLEVQNKFAHAPQDSTLMSAISMARAT